MRFSGRRSRSGRKGSPFETKYINSPENNGRDAGDIPVFNPLLLLEMDLGSLCPAGYHYYTYKNFSVSSSIEIIEGHPYRVISLAPHGSKKPMADSELYGLLRHFGLFEFLPVYSWSCSNPEDPYTGNTTFYQQPLQDMASMQG